MKIIKKLKWVFLTILIGVAGVLLNENFIHLYISKSVFYSILASGMVLVVAVYFIPSLKKYGLHKFLLALTIGALLVPYLSLIKGYSNIFAKDQAGMTVKEVRFKIVKIDFKKEGEDVWENNFANREAILYPGKNWVWIGRQELAAYGHDRERGIFETEADILWDQNLISQEHPDWQVPTSGNNSEVIRSEDLGEGKYLITFFRREEFERPLLKPAGAEGQPPPPIPVYPDVGMDVIIGEDGRITGMTLHLLLPAPFEELTIEVPR
ncbi:MAG: hypothetical protein WC587_03855 [Candidatus Paceibacterota bacterium]